MKDEKKENVAEEVKEEEKTEENGVELTEDKLSSVAAGNGVRYNVLGEIVK